MPATKAIQTQTSAPDASAIESVLVAGDLSKLTTEQRISYYNQVCNSLGLNPLTRPFEYVTFQGRLTLYARRDCTDQLRSNRGVSVVITSREVSNDILVVSARASLQDGRTDESIGAVNIQGLKGDALANAYMKAETKAKRRVTLSICGLGWTDETELETIPGAQVQALYDPTSDLEYCKNMRTPKGVRLGDMTPEQLTEMKNYFEAHPDAMLKDKDLFAALTRLLRIAKPDVVEIIDPTIDEVDEGNQP